MIYDDEVWVYPTWSDEYGRQLHFDCFSSKDLVHWTKHENILTNKEVTWAWQAMWAPAAIRKDGKYYLFFGANDIQNNDQPGGIGVAVADRPEGPYKDLLGRPLIDKIVNGAQPIDQFVLEDDGQYYMYYGGWGHCNVVKLNDDFTDIVPFPDGELYKEVTPDPKYVEGSFVIKRNGQYVFMWSEGGWGSPDYSVAYAVSDRPFGPFKRVGKILQQDPSVATSAGHHSVINIPGTERWYIFYHRRPKGDKARDHRQTCIDRMEFESPESNTIRPVKMTFEGVGKERIRTPKKAK